jgi:hypothetical protein
VKKPVRKNRGKKERKKDKQKKETQEIIVSFCRDHFVDCVHD